MDKFTKEDIIETLRYLIVSTNLYDRDVYNLGYRDALRDAIDEFKEK